LNVILAASCCEILSAGAIDIDDRDNRSDIRLHLVDQI
jgi:hypothetical protein